MLSQHCTSMSRNWKRSFCQNRDDSRSDPASRLNFGGGEAFLKVWGWKKRKHMMRKSMKDPHFSPKTNMDVSENSDTPKSSILIGFSDFHYKPSILGYPYFWKHPHSFQKRSWLGKLLSFGHGKTGEIALTVMELQGMNHFAKNKPDFPRWKKMGTFPRCFSVIKSCTESLRLISDMVESHQTPRTKTGKKGWLQTENTSSEVYKVEFGRELFWSKFPSRNLNSCTSLGGNCRKCVLRYSHLILVGLSGQNVEKWEKKIRQD